MPRRASRYPRATPDDWADRFNQRAQKLGCAASEVYLLDRGDARAIIDAQVDVIRTQWGEAADAARLTELDRRLLYGREILNEFAFRD